MKKLFIILLLPVFFLLSSCQRDALYIATTTSLRDSGLLDYIIPVFEEEYGIEVNVVAVGTGAALEYGEAGAVEILLVHDTAREIEFIENGFGTKRADIMYNDFIIIGPEKLTSLNLNDAMNEIYNNYNFYSRDDASGTHSKELTLWENAGLDVDTFGDFYKRIGKGMGDTIVQTDISQFYTLSDRSTYLSMLENIDLVIAYENSVELINQYGVIKVNPDSYDGSDDYAELFYNWILTQDTKDLIATYKMYDTQLFYTD